jgi:uncharacterized protein (TIGR03086 family)
MDAPDQARTAVNGLTPLVHAISASQLGNSTPCEKWAVRDLLNHLVGGGHMFAICLNGGTIDMSNPPGDLLGDDHAAAFDAAIAAFSSALDATADLSAPVTLPFGTMPADVALRIAAADLLVHSWDLSQATGQPFAPPDDFVESAAPFYEQFLQPALRDGEMFGEAVQPPAGATPIERLVAFAGRQP